MEQKEEKQCLQKKNSTFSDDSMFNLNLRIVDYFFNNKGNLTHFIY